MGLGNQAGDSKPKLMPIDGNISGRSGGKDFSARRCVSDSCRNLGDLPKPSWLSWVIGIEVQSYSRRYRIGWAEPFCEAGIGKHRPSDSPPRTRERERIGMVPPTELASAGIGSSIVDDRLPLLAAFGPAIGTGLPGTRLAIGELDDRHGDCAIRSMGAEAQFSSPEFAEKLVHDRGPPVLPCRVVTRNEPTGGDLYSLGDRLTASTVLGRRRGTSALAQIQSLGFFAVDPTRSASG